MPDDIKIRKGLTIKLKGEAEKIIAETPRPKTFAIAPPDFHSVVPKMIVKEGDTVTSGETLFFSKYSERVKFVSPVSGRIALIKRGAKRRILEIRIDADTEDLYKDFGIKDFNKLTAEEIKSHLLESGCWPFIKQRPYDIIANPEDTPKAIFISTHITAPLAADMAFVLKDRKKDFQAGIHAISKLTQGKTHLSIAKHDSEFFSDIKGVELHHISGPHPAGNVGVHIHHIDPLNAGERVWVINPEDVAIIGSLFKTGRFNAKRIVAVSGTEAPEKRYVTIKIGADIRSIVGEVPSNVRIISGDVLTGNKISNEGFVGYYHNTITLIPEGNHYRMFGWIPFKDNHIPSMSKTSLSWLFPNKKYTVNTSLNGEERAFVVTGEMEKVFPMDIYPMQLLKECMAGNIEKMENLGIYEVAPEDFALIDYVSTSKIEAQQIIREGLDLMIEEVG